VRLGSSYRCDTPLGKVKFAPTRAGCSTLRDRNAETLTNKSLKAAFLDAHAPHCKFSKSLIFNLIRYRRVATFCSFKD
jgi:hypothetical protein